MAIAIRLQTPLNIFACPPPLTASPSGYAFSRQAADTYALCFVARQQERACAPRFLRRFAVAAPPALRYHILPPPLDLPRIAAAVFARLPLLLPLFRLPRRSFHALYAAAASDAARACI